MWIFAFFGGYGKESNAQFITKKGRLLDDKGHPGADCGGIYVLGGG